MCQQIISNQQSKQAWAKLAYYPYQQVNDCGRNKLRTLKNIEYILIRALEDPQKGMRGELGVRKKQRNKKHWGACISMTKMKERKETGRKKKHQDRLPSSTGYLHDGQGR